MPGKNSRHNEHYLIPWAAQNDADTTLVKKGEGVYFYDDKGQKYLDLSSQLMNLNLGFSNQEMQGAVQKQLAELSYIAPNFATEPKMKLGKQLAELSPGNLQKTLFTTGGSTANEMALIMAKLYSGKPKILARQRSYHGATRQTIALSGDPRRVYSRVSPSHIIRFPDPYCYRCSLGYDKESCDLQCLNLLEENIKLEGSQDFAALIIEPITGSNGCIVPPEPYFPALKDICERYNILLIADEVINGFGRTGKWFCIEHWGIEPDMITFAKGINSGYIPLGGALVQKEIADFFDERSLPVGFTYSGHPAACASCLAAINYIKENKIISRAAEQGDYMLRLLGELQKKHQIVGEARGKGLQAALELVKNKETREPLVARGEDSKITSNIYEKLMDKGVYTQVRWNIIFLAPPLIITREELEKAVEIIDEVLIELTKELKLF